MTKEKKIEPNFYFWLGAEGVESVTEDEFEIRQEGWRQSYDKWKNVDVGADKGDGGRS